MLSKKEDMGGVPETKGGGASISLTIPSPGWFMFGKTNATNQAIPPTSATVYRHPLVGQL
jgi:hypothetical protein